VHPAGLKGWPRIDPESAETAALPAPLSQNPLNPVQATISPTRRWPQVAPPLPPYSGFAAARRCRRDWRLQGAAQVFMKRCMNKTARHDRKPRATPAALQRAVRLRHDEASAGERRLWTLLRALNREGAGFRREAAVGRYVYDFAWLSARLLVEVDGGVHRLPGIAERDARKALAATMAGYRVLRFSTDEVFSKPLSVECALRKAGAMADRVPRAGCTRNPDQHRWKK